MSKRVSFVALVSALAAVPVSAAVLTGCSGDDTNPPLASTPDASVHAVGDAGAPIADATPATDSTAPGTEGGTNDAAVPPDGSAPGPDAGADADSADASPFAVQILAVNDFHGNLQPPTGSSGRVVGLIGDPLAGDAGYSPNADAGTELIAVGGVAWMATHLQTLRSANPNTVLVSAGDLTGASPLDSALFHDDPTILIWNQIGLDFHGVGNHEFDHGIGELLRYQFGGCNPTDGCVGEASFPGASFEYLAANVNVAAQKTIFPPYAIRTFNGVKIAFVGETLQGTPEIVSAQEVQGLTFGAEAAALNALVPELKAQGVVSIVALVHQGAIPASGTPYDGCGVTSGAIVDIANALDPMVDVVVSAHTHTAYNCVIGGRIVTSAASYGRLFTKIDLTVDPALHRVVAKSAHNRPVTRDVVPDPTVQGILANYEALAAPLENKIVGHVTATLTQAGIASGESILGDVIADADLAATAPKNNGGAVIAFMNPGGVRGDLTDTTTDGGLGAVTYGAAFTVQPFGDPMITMTLSGAQVLQLLEQQFLVNEILLPSSSLTYTYVAHPDSGPHVVSGSVRVNGVAIDPNASYRVSANSYLATGGDGFSVFNQGTNLVGGPVDVDALVAWLGANDPLVPPALNRITAE